VIGSRLLRVACAGALAAGLALAGCRKQESEEPQPVKGELPVEQTPVSSIYEEKPGVLYARPARTPRVTPASTQPTVTGVPRATPHS
jgi:uncharacterized lipoprotein YbaY